MSSYGSHARRMTESHLYRIAEFYISIEFYESALNGTHLIPSFQPFEQQGGRYGFKNLLFSLSVDDSLSPIPKGKRERIRDFDTGNGHIIVDQIRDEGYQYIIKDLSGHNCCLLQTNRDFTISQCALNGNFGMRSYGLSNALMLIFAFRGSHQKALLIHASLVRQGIYGYPFVAKSGTGKSTHVNLWMKNVPGCDLMNDDNPIIRIIEGRAYIYGSPWSGKTPCYRDVKARLGAITRIDRATSNKIEKLRPIEAFASLLPTCSSMKWDKPIFDNICNIISEIIGMTDIYTLHCRPDNEAAILCHNTISQQKKKDTTTPYSCLKS